MSNLLDYAKNELTKIGMIGSGEPYNECVANAILELIATFSNQGHSGFTAPYTINAFRRLASWEPLAPLTGKEDEWNDIGDRYQNKRYSSVFKDKDGKVYNSNGKIFSDDGGKTWFTNKDSFVDITFPYTVPDYPEKVYIYKQNK